MKTACKHGACNRLFDDTEKCDYLFEHKNGDCIYMSQTTGACKHRLASKPKQRVTKNTSNDWFYQKSCSQFAEYDRGKNGY